MIARAFRDAFRISAIAILFSFGILTLSACGGGGGGGDGTPHSFTVSGTITGLSGSGLTLQNNGGDNLTVSNAAGSFKFSAALADHASYDVSVLTQPSTPAQSCTVTNGTGTINGSNVTNVHVSCTTNSYLVGGTVTGLTGSGLVLQLNGGNDLPITSANRNFTFPVAVASGNGYKVTVSASPSSPSQTCTVTNGEGTIGNSNVDNIIVSCTAVSGGTSSINASVSGLTGPGLSLRLNGGTPVSIGSDGTHSLGTVSNGVAYSVVVASQPSAQTCTIANGSGTASGGTITVTVTCAANLFSVGGTVAGLSGTGLELQLNGGNNLSITGNGGFTFPNPIADGSPYSVTVRTQPSSPSQTCAVSQSSSTVQGSAVTDVQVVCTTNSFPVSVTVNGLSGAGLVLQNNSGSDLSIPTNGSFTFGGSVQSGANYLVTVLTQPSSPNQTCTLTNGSGIVGNGAVTNVLVDCAINTYIISGTVTGLTGTGLELQLNGGSKLPASNGSFAFTAIADGSSYNVTVATQPTSTPGQTCTVTNGTGKLAGAAVTNVTVSCSNLKWSGVKQFGSAADDVANAVATDASGNVVVVGCFQGALSSDNYNKNASCNTPGGNAKVIIQKYDSSGAAVWSGPALLGNSANTQANAVAIDSSGNIYVTGISTGSLDGEPGINDDDVFLVKYDSNGTKQWTRVFGSPSADRGNALAFGPDGSLYLAGTTLGTLGSSNLGDFDAFVARFDKTAFLDSATPPHLADTAPWAAAVNIFQFGTNQRDVGVGLAVDASGNIYVSGFTLGGLDGSSSAGGADAFVSKRDSNGNKIWTKQLGAAGDDINAGLALRGTNVFVAGHTPGVVSGSSGNLTDLFVANYDTDGNQQWVKQLPSGGHDFATGIAADASGNVIVTGFTNGDFGLTPSVNHNADATHNTNDVFLVKYNASGGLVWTREFGSTTDDKAYAVAADAEGSAFVVGYTLGALDGNVNAGGADLFVVKYDSLGTRQ